jgi:hypothetical protein
MPNLITQDEPVHLPATKTLADVDMWLQTLPGGEDHKLPFVELEDGTSFEHQEFGDRQIVRAEDVEIGWKLLIERFMRGIEDYLFAARLSKGVVTSREGKIYWRIRPEFSQAPLLVFTEYDESAPDKCFSTDKNGVVDKGWVILSAYARLSRAPKKDLQNAA